MVALAVALTAAPATAAEGLEPARGPTALPPIVQQVDIEEHLGRRVDRSLTFTDMRGNEVTLGEELGSGKPVVLVLAYYHCPMLCGLVLRSAVQGLGELPYRLGGDYRAITVSFDPRDTPEAAARKRQSTLAGLGRVEACGGEWPFLVGGARETAALADEIGFRYAYDARTGEYAHPAALLVLTPDGRISRYLYGATFAARDLRLALLEAGEGKIGSIVDRVIMTCYHYDPASRAYGPYVLGFIRLGGVLILVTVSGIVAAAFVVGRRKGGPS
jgi:protein SCO1/2